MLATLQWNIQEVIVYELVYEVYELTFMDDFFELEILGSSLSWFADEYDPSLALLCISLLVSISCQK